MRGIMQARQKSLEVLEPIKVDPKTFYLINMKNLHRKEKLR